MLFQNWCRTKEGEGGKHPVVPSVHQRASPGSCRNASLIAAWRMQGRFAGFSEEHRNPRYGPDMLTWVLCKDSGWFYPEVVYSKRRK